MKLNKHIFILFFFITSIATAKDYNAVFDSANNVYSKNEFEKAIKMYESILTDDQESAEIYFNLANAYYKTNKIGLAILNYERAKKLNPNDDDISTNLKLANQKTEDKIDVAPQLFLAEWKNGIVDLASEKKWSIICILLFTIGLGLLIIYFISKNNVFKQIGFFGGVVIIIFAFITFFVAKNKYYSTLNSSEGIITAASVTVSGSPDEKGTKLFILHEGTKVKITNEESDWTEIKIANGNVGWLQSKNLSPI